MISIFVMYSPDRKSQLEQMIRLNSRMIGWEDADKILLVDGEANCHPEGFRVIEVPRPSGSFNWSKMWMVGVESSVNEKVLYLDSDRVLPIGYLSKLEERITDNSFVFCDSLFGLKCRVNDEFVMDLVDNHTAEDLRTDFDAYKDLMYYDPRYQLPLRGPGKGVMSGNTGFTRKGFYRSGGVDPFYETHGAYADLDFQHQVWSQGFDLVALDDLEIHLWHPKLSDSSEELTMRDIEILSLNNFVYHAKKWDLGYAYPKAIAKYLKLGDNFVERVLEQIEIGGTFEPIMH